MTPETLRAIKERDASWDDGKEWHGNAAYAQKCPKLDGQSHMIGDRRALLAEVEALRDKVELMFWALHGNTCWLGTTVQNGRAQYIAVYQPRPYAAPEAIDETAHEDAVVCLERARAFLAATEPKP